MSAGHPEARLGGLSVTLSPFVLAGVLAASFGGGVLVAIQIGHLPAGAARQGQLAPAPAFDRITFLIGERQPLVPVFDATQFRIDEQQPLFPAFNATQFRNDEHQPLFPAR